jgi:hypothetical protein
MFSDDVRAAVRPIVQSFPMVPVENRKLYVGALTVCYHSMVASEPLLKLAAGLEGPHQGYFVLHEAEERGHEKWMAEDIEALEGEIGEPFPEIITMCGEMYYRVRHQNPAALLGYMATIEGFPLDEAVVRRLQELYPKGSRTLTYHSLHDISHGHDLKEQLDHHTAFAEQDLIMVSAIRTAELYRDALWRLFAKE